MNKKDIIRLILETLKEDPDTVLGTEEQGELASSDDVSIVFVAGNFGEGNQCLYYDGRPSQAPDHNHVWALALARYPDRRKWDLKNMSRGRIWADKQLCSIYEDESTYVKYSLAIEKMFKDLKFDINKFRFEYGDSAMEGNLLGWNQIKSSGKKQNISKEAEKAKERLTQILQDFHLQDPVKKQKLRVEMDGLRKIMGATESDLDAAIRLAGEKAASQEKQYGSMAQANYMKGAIAEETIRLYNKGLNPMFWNPDSKLKPEIRKQLLLIAYDFLKESEVKINVIDIRFLGSLSGFNYTQESDIDIHITTDMKQLGIPDAQILRFGKGISTKWNEDHDIRIHGHKVELFIEDVSSVNRAAGIYSLFHDTWLRVPQRQNVQFDKEGIKSLYYDLTKKIDDVIATNEVIQMRDVLKKISDMRKMGLTHKGEFSNENIVFKILRSKGWIEKIKNAANTQLDKDLSLNESSLPSNPVYSRKVISGITLEDMVFSTTRDHYELSQTVDNYGDYKRWRWGVDDDKVSWWDTPNLHERKVTSDHIKEKYGYEVNKHGFGSVVLNEVSMDRDFKDGSWSGVRQNGVKYEFDVDEKFFHVLFEKAVNHTDLEEMLPDEIYSTSYGRTVRGDLDWFADEYDVWIISFHRILRDPHDSRTQYKTDLTKDTGTKSVHVYTHVLSSIKKFLQTYDPHYLVMIAPDDARTRLYTLFDKKFVKSVGLTRLKKDPVIGYDVPPHTFIYKTDKVPTSSTKGYDDRDEINEVSLDKDLKNGSWTKPNQNEVSYEFEIDGKVFYVVFGEAEWPDLLEMIPDGVYSSDRDAIKNDLEWFAKQYDVRIISFLRVTKDLSGSNIQLKTDIRKDMGNKAAHVYTHVLSSIKKFLQGNKPHFIIMTAPDESRSNIYNLFDKKFANLVGLERMTEDPILGFDLPKHILFYKNKNSSLPSIKNQYDTRSSD